MDESLDLLNLSSPVTLDIEELQMKHPSTSRQTSQDCSSVDEAAAPKTSTNPERTVQDGGASENPSASNTPRTGDFRAVQDIALVSHLVPAIIDHDQLERQKAFNTAMYSCNVCFSEKQGCDCINFMGCDHVYCKECMKEYFKVQISDGNVKCLNCPETKCDSQALPSQVMLDCP